MLSPPAPSEAPQAPAYFVYEELISSTDEEESNQPVSQNTFEGRYIGQYNNSFLLLAKRGQLSIVDQHALEEAIIFENLCKSELKNVLK